MYVCVVRILEAARCSHVTDAGFTVLARVSSVFCPASLSLGQPCISLLHLPELLLFSSSQNCHELEKMDLEECILVRRRLASGLMPNIVLMVVLCLSCSNSWL